MKCEEKAKRIIEAIEESTMPISWHHINDSQLIEVISKVLKDIEEVERMEP